MTRMLLMPIALLAYLLWDWPRAVAASRRARRRLRAARPRYVAMLSS